jgi:hypothetical protein
MPKQGKLSSDKEKEGKFIIMFTIGFVVVASALLLTGYAVLSVTGMLGNSTDASPTPASGPTPVPTWQIIGVPTETVPSTPTPVPCPTPTPAPTPVPPKYSFTYNIDVSEAGSMVYHVAFSLRPGSLSLDMTKVTVSIWEGSTIYHNYTYTEAMYWLDGVWHNDNNDTRLDPIGESIEFRFSDYDLNIPPSKAPRMTLALDGETLATANLPSLLNSGDTTGSLPAYMQEGYVPDQWPFPK